MSEESIMRELRANGPVAFDFMAGKGFASYKKGVLYEHHDTVGQKAFEAAKDVSLTQISSSLIAETDSTDENLSSEEVSDRNYDDYGLMWQKLTHATLLIGWGYDEKLDMKYWLVRNSYGPSWGENGNFRVRRGQNDYGAEGENMAATPVLL
jgi:hypothetical protein